MSTRRGTWRFRPDGEEDEASMERRRVRAKSVLTSRSCVSSRIRWEIVWIVSGGGVSSSSDPSMSCVCPPAPPSPPSFTSMRSSTPIVTKMIRHDLRSARLSPLTMYPTPLPDLPGAGHPLSSATRRASETAATLLGCVTTMYGLRRSASPSASSMNCGVCVDFPLPVVPLSTVTAFSATDRNMSSRSAWTGSLLRVAANASRLPASKVSGVRRPRAPASRRCRFRYAALTASRGSTSSPSSSSSPSLGSPPASPASGTENVTCTTDPSSSPDRSSPSSRSRTALPRATKALAGTFLSLSFDLDCLRRSFTVVERDTTTTRLAPIRN
mmetsp:Transcript_36210/g.81390  ORF Transcript_36210/g.81390 Transcript_36210/m.81390 type:complete len:327 (+) Transcript_36210:1009-1989(+)